MTEWRPRKRVVVFSPGLTEAGGAARRSRLLVTELARRGWIVRVVTRAGTRKQFGTLRGERLFVLEVPGFDAPRLGAVFFLLCAVPLGLLWGARARLFLSIQITSQTTAAALCGLALRKPYLAFLTTGGSVSEVAYVTGRRSAGFRKHLLGRARYLVAQTDDAVSSLRAAFPGPQVAVVANPVVGIQRTPLNGRPNALFTGRFSEEKDLLRLLEAWRRIAAADDGARLTLAGAGGSYRSVEDEIRKIVAGDHILARSVHLPGWVDDVSELLRDNDVYIFPSLSEGMSNSLLEASAAGRVVAASDIPPNRAVLGDEHPLLFAAGDIDAMEATLRLALYDSEARDHAIRNMTGRVDAFSLERFVTEVEGLMDADSPRH